jgi:hypothetical protein
VSTRYRPAAGGLKPKYQDTVTCYVCGFAVHQHRAVSVTVDDERRWRHRELNVCDEKLEGLALSDRLLGRNHAKTHTE